MISGVQGSEARLASAKIGLGQATTLVRHFHSCSLQWQQDLSIINSPASTGASEIPSPSWAASKRGGGNANWRVSSALLLPRLLRTRQPPLCLAMAGLHLTAQLTGQLVSHATNVSP